jgi:hypothetical protein
VSGTINDLCSFLEEELENKAEGIEIDGAYRYRLGMTPTVTLQIKVVTVQDMTDKETLENLEECFRSVADSIAEFKERISV